MSLMSSMGVPCTLPRQRALRLLAAIVVTAILLLPGSPARAVPAPDPPAPPQPAAPRACPAAAVPLDADAWRLGLRQAHDHGFLWRIVKGGRTSFLFGTIHAAQPGWMFPGPRTRAALRASDVLALELDVLDPAVQSRLVQAAAAGPDDRLPAPLAARLEQRFEAECVDPAPWRAFAPEFQVAALSALAARRDGLDPAYAIDLVLAVTARDLGKASVSLETPESQVAALRLPTREATLEFVASSLDELDSGRAGPLLGRLAADWTAGDLADLEGYERWCECLNSAAERAAMARLLDERNPQLADRIDALHRGGRAVFAAVGSLHMIGANGLPTLLRQRGYLVERVMAGP